MTRLLVVSILAALLAGCASGGSNQSGSKEGESQGVISDLQSARMSASTLSARKFLFTKVKGTFGRGDAATKFEAFYHDEVLRLVAEEADHGDRGNSERAFFIDAQGHLYYYTGSEQRAKKGGKDKMRTRIAFDEHGKVVGSEKTLNGQDVAVSDAEVKGVTARLEALRRVAAATKTAAK